MNSIWLDGAVRFISLVNFLIFQLWETMMTWLDFFPPRELIKHFKDEETKTVMAVHDVAHERGSGNNLL